MVRETPQPPKGGTVAASLPDDLLQQTVKRSAESATRFLRFDTVGWTELLVDRLRNDGHDVSAADRQRLQARVEDYAHWLLSFTLQPESPAEARDAAARRASQRKAGSG